VDGATAVVEIRDGAATGKILWSSRTGTSNAAVADSPYWERGLATKDGIYVNIVSGTPTVEVYAS
jgi:hypothetical protein